MKMTVEVPDKIYSSFKEEVAESGNKSVEVAVLELMQFAIADKDQKKAPEKCPELWRLKDFLDNNYQDPVCRSLGYVIDAFLQGRTVRPPETSPLAR